MKEKFWRQNLRLKKNTKKQLKKKAIHNLLIYRLQSQLQQKLLIMQKKMQKKKKREKTAICYKKNKIKKENLQIKKVRKKDLFLIEYLNRSKKVKENIV